MTRNTRWLNLLPGPASNRVKATDAGFSPRPNPKLIATFPTRGPAVAVSRGLDRDRVVDESGNQTVVFGRRGARPFNAAELTAFYRHSENSGPALASELYSVEDITTRDGRLATKSGGELKPSLEFSPEPVTTATRPANNERIFRRGK